MYLILFLLLLKHRKSLFANNNAMAFLSFFASISLFLVVINLSVHVMLRGYGSWLSAHATFYGGEAAFGTMGKLEVIVSLSSMKYMFVQ